MLLHRSARMSASLCVVVGVACIGLTGCKKPHPDTSLAENEYVSRGVPDPSKPWSIAHCVRAAQAIETIGKANPKHLPRVRSKKSGSVYARYATLCIEHMTAPRDPVTQMRNLVQVMDVSQRLLGIYGATMGTGDNTHAQEFIDLSGAFLLVWSEAIPISTRFLKGIPGDAPSYQSRVDGLAKMLSGVSLSVHGALSMVGNPSYPDFARARLARRLEQALPVLLDGVSKDRADIMQSLRDVAKDSPNPNIRQPLERAIRAAETAKTPTKP